MRRPKKRHSCATSWCGSPTNGRCAVVECLDVNGEMRFTRLQESVGGVSQKMLTKTLRQLERDGLVTRNVHASIPPRVDYKLTPLGESFSESICGVCTWAGQNMQRVAAGAAGF